MKNIEHTMKYWISLLALVACGLGFSQTIAVIDSSKIDNKYREDQFYGAITYNWLINKPNDASQTGFSSGFHFGFLRDMPFNQRRNWAVALGLGVSFNSYNQNIVIAEVNNETTYNIIDDRSVNVKKNKFSTYLVELPLELRWRTSTAIDYSFWRIYAGAKIGYVVQSVATFKSDDINERVSNIEGFLPFQYGLTLSVGYGKVNFHAYYGLNPIFDKNATLDTAAIDMGTVKLGLIFFVL